MNKKERPLKYKEYAQDFYIEGKLCFTTSLLTYGNKSYYRIRISFPDGSYEQCFVACKRLSPLKEKGA